VQIISMMSQRMITAIFLSSSTLMGFCDILIQTPLL
jgi:hypothetical protein